MPPRSNFLVTTTGPALRLDIWLWAARFFKTRNLARQAVETGKVEVGGQRAKPARAVRIGDGFRIVRGDEPAYRDWLTAA